MEKKEEMLITSKFKTVFCGGLILPFFKAPVFADKVNPLLDDKF